MLTFVCSAAAVVVGGLARLDELGALKGLEKAVLDRLADALLHCVALVVPAQVGELE